jgi:hypothetical protein
VLQPTAPPRAQKGRYHLQLTSFTVDTGRTGGRVRPVGSIYREIPTLTCFRCCQNSKLALRLCDCGGWTFNMTALEGEKNSNVCRLYIVSAESSPSQILQAGFDTQELNNIITKGKTQIIEGSVPLTFTILALPLSRP